MNKTALNYSWQYIPHFEEKYIKNFPESILVNIPHTNKELPFNNFSELDYQFISSYEKHIDIKKKADKRYLLEFEGVMTYFELYINERLVTSHKGGYTPHKADITDHIKHGINKIFVKVDSREREDIPPFGFVVDFLTYGGIYREVYLYEYDEDYIDQVFCDVVDEELKLELFTKGYKKESKELEFVISKESKVIHTFNETIDFKENKAIIKKALELELWTLENPVLYTIDIYDKKQLLFSTRFGNRSVDFTKDGFFLNKKPIKLYGLNRHQSFPYVGYAMPSNAQRKDADILKFELGVNTVRSSHYPPSKHFLDRCDEIGLLVFNEIPGWQHIGNEEWQSTAVTNTYEMVYRDYNHPSIFIWGTRINESPDNDSFYFKTNTVAKSLDKQRPTGGVRNFPGSALIEDVYTYNDFVHRGDNKGLQSRKAVAKKEVPYLVTEFNGHMYPTKKFDDEWHRNFQVERHLNVQNDNFKSKDIAGAIGWCMFDYNTHKDFGSGDRICYHGVLDMFRIPKYASSVYSMQRDLPYLEILGNLNIGEQEASEIKQVMVMTNADSVKFYINDEFLGDFKNDKPKKDTKWGYLPHSPIIIRDFIGNMIHDNEPYSKKDCDTVKEILMAIMKHGMNIPLRLKLKMLFFLKRNKLSIDQAAKFYEKYVGKWGLESVSYRFEAIKNGEVVEKRTVGSTHDHKLLVEIDDTELFETDTYQTTRIVLKHVNMNNNIMTYSSEVVSITLEGPLEIIGPKHIHLRGGSTAFYVKTIQKKGLAHLKLSTTNLGEYHIDIDVK